MSYYYDKTGNVLTLMQWAELFENMEYRRIAETTIETSVGPI